MNTNFPNDVICSFETCQGENYWGLGQQSAERTEKIKREAVNFKTVKKSIYKKLIKIILHAQNILTELSDCVVIIKNIECHKCQKLFWESAWLESPQWRTTDPQHGGNWDFQKTSSDFRHHNTLSIRTQQGSTRAMWETGMAAFLHRY